MRCGTVVGGVSCCDWDESGAVVATEGAVVGGDVVEPPVAGADEGALLAGGEARPGVAWATYAEIAPTAAKLAAANTLVILLSRLRATSRSVLSDWWPA